VSCHSFRQLFVSARSADRRLGVVACGRTLCHNFVKKFLQLHDHLIRDALPAAAGVDRRYCGLVNAAPTFNLLLRQAAPEEFGNDGLSVHLARILHLYLKRKYQSNPRPYYDCNI